MTRKFRSPSGAACAFVQGPFEVLTLAKRTTPGAQSTPPPHVARPYSLDSARDLLPHAATFPVFCLGIVVALYASVMFVVLRFMPGEDIAARQQARQALWLLYPTAALLGLLAIVTDGSWSIDAIVLVSP